MIPDSWNMLIYCIEICLVKVLLKKITLNNCNLVWILESGKVNTKIYDITVTLCLQRSQDMQRAGTLRCQARHSCNLSWVWAAVSPLPSPMVCDWSTPQTAVITGLSSPQSACPQPLAVLVILRVPSIPRPSTNTGGGSLSTCPVLLSTCFWTFIPKISRH